MSSDVLKAIQAPVALAHACLFVPRAESVFEQRMENIQRELEAETRLVADGRCLQKSFKLLKAMREAVKQLFDDHVTEAETLVTAI